MCAQTSTWARRFTRIRGGRWSPRRGIRYAAQADDGDPFGLQYGSYWKGFVNGYVYRVLRYLGEPVQPRNTMIAAVTASMEVSLDFGSDLAGIDEGFTANEAGSGGSVEWLGEEPKRTKPPLSSIRRENDLSAGP